MDWVQVYHCIIVCSFSVFPFVVARDTMFVTDIRANKIRKAPIESLDFEDIPLQHVQAPFAVDYDPVDHKLYWVNTGSRAAIIRANLDGTQEQVVVPYLSVPRSLSIDVTNRHLYWTDTGTKRIERANMDGTNKVIITSENHDEPRAIVVDSQGGLIYWTDWGVNNSRIERANLDGRGRVVLVETGLHLPYGLAVDFEGKRIYWCDAGLNTIDTTDLNGQNRVNLGTFSTETIGFDLRPFDIVVYNEDVYWTDWALTKIIQMNKFVGRQAYVVGPAIFEQAGGLHIFMDEVDECSSNPCNAGECVDEINFYSCNCTATGFEGDHCEINIDDCAAAPCLNAGICQDSVNGFSCQCTPGFHGDICEQENIDECLSYPCANGGTCMDLENKFECRCTPGYEGVTCNLVRPTNVDKPITPGPQILSTKSPNSGNSAKCAYPGDIDNGHVIRGKSGDTFAPGTGLEFVCKDEYDLVGTKTVYCQTDGTWSDEAPTCVADSEESFVSSYVIYGGGAGGGILIIILLIILIVVCCKKGNKNELPNPVVHYTANGAQAPKGPKERAKYSTSGTIHYHPEPTMGAGSDRPAMPMPRGGPTSHVYDSVNFGAEGAVGGVGRCPSDRPPSYISSIGDRKGVEGGEFNHGYMTLTKDQKDAEIESEYLYMKTNEVKTPVYDVPKRIKDNE